MINKIYHHFLHDPLYRSSSYVMLSTFVMAFLGFFFWMVVARTFKTEYVGIATTLISIQTFLGLFSNIGLNMGLINYLPLSKKRNDIINSSFIVTALASVTASLIFLGGLHVFSPQLLFLWTNPLYIVTFIIFMIFATWNTIIESIFMAYRASGNILIKNTLLSILKLVFPFLFLVFGSYGIFSSVSLAVLLSCVTAISILVYKYGYQPKLHINTKLLGEMSHFAISNYISSFLYQAPTLLMPLLIVNYLHPKDAAYYYIASMILNFLIIIPLASTQALLAEGSYNAALLREQVIKAVRIIAELLIPAVLLIFFFGNIILHFFGKDYEHEAFQLVQLFSISSLFTSVIMLGSAVLRVKHKIIQLIWTNAFFCIAVLGGAYLFISHGLMGVGIGWIAGQGLVSILFMYILWKELRKR